MLNQQSLKISCNRIPLIKAHQPWRGFVLEPMRPVWGRLQHVWTILLYNFHKTLKTCEGADRLYRMKMNITATRQSCELQRREMRVFIRCNNVGLSVCELSAYCTHSVALPFCMYSAMHLTSWSFSFSSWNQPQVTPQCFSIVVFKDFIWSSVTKLNLIYMFLISNMHLWEKKKLWKFVHAS